MNRPELIVMVGLPGSGKDYWINLFLQDKDASEYYIASTDAIIEEYAASVGKTYSDVFDGQVNLATKRMNSEVAEAIKARKNIIWNQTNMAPGKRRKILSQFPKDYIKTVVDIKVDADIHFARLDERAVLTGKNIPQFVILNMQKTYVAPSREEGFDEVIEVLNN